MDHGPHRVLSLKTATQRQHGTLAPLWTLLLHCICMYDMRANYSPSLLPLVFVIQNFLHEQTRHIICTMHYFGHAWLPLVRSWRKLCMATTQNLVTSFVFLIRNYDVKAVDYTRYGSRST